VTILNFSVYCQLPGLNDIISVARSHPLASASQKKKWTNLVARAMTGIHPLPTPVGVMFDWYERGRRDPDNVMAGQKYIFDALVGKGVIPDDSWANVLSISHRFHTAKESRVDVTVFEVAPSGGDDD
jgi:Holliday junction resolvase RusA-like endonuclease